MTTTRWTPMRLRVGAVLGAAALALTMVACQSGGSGGASSNSTTATDDGTTLTMWTRAATSSFSQSLIDAYNQSHKNQVKLTTIPNDSYQQKVATAAGAKQLPDILASDVVYAPNYAEKGIYADITAKVNSLSFKDDLAPSHMKAATLDGKVYAVPHDIDLSAMFYNKVLFTQAGLDPNKPPTTLSEMYDDAAKISALGGDSKGYFFGGGCPGCMLFSTWPMIWASGGTVISDDGKSSTIDNTQAGQVYDIYRKMVANGVVSDSVKSENGTTWVQAFTDGKVGIQPLGATALANMTESDQLQVGVAPIPGLTGGESSFIGGDVLGISTTSSKADQAWDFISWTLGDDAQVNVIAKNKGITTRTDLSDNQYAQQDARLQTFNDLVTKGQTPDSVNFGATYNDPNGPWTAAITGVLFGSADAATALKSSNGSITSSLQGGS